MDSLTHALRAAASAALPAGAFLRRDRGDALFVTDAPRLYPEADWPVVLAGAGFACTQSGGLLRLVPDAGWLRRLEADQPEPPDDLCASLRRFRGIEPEAQSLRLFALGAKCLEVGADAANFDRLLRQRTAVCLRLNALNPEKPPRGGGLYACALLDYALEVRRL